MFLAVSKAFVVSPCHLASCVNRNEEKFKEDFGSAISNPTSKIYMQSLLVSHNDLRRRFVMDTAINQNIK